MALTAALGWYWYVRGTWRAARRRLESVLAHPSGDPVARGVSLGWLAHFALVIDADLDAALAAAREQPRADGGTATRCCRRAPTCSSSACTSWPATCRPPRAAGGGDAAARRPGRAVLDRDVPLLRVGRALSAGRIEEAEPLIAEAVACFRRSGERWSLLNALLHGGTVLELAAGSTRRRRGSVSRSSTRRAPVPERRGARPGAAGQRVRGARRRRHGRRVCAQCIDLARELDDGTLLNATRVVLARVARARGELDEADALTEACSARRRSATATSRVAANERGFALALAGRRDEALALHREVLPLSARALTPASSPPRWTASPAASPPPTLPASRCCSAPPTPSVVHRSPASAPTAPMSTGWRPAPVPRSATGSTTRPSKPAADFRSRTRSAPPRRDHLVAHAGMSLRAAQGVNVTSMAAVDMSGEAEGVGHLGKRALVRREGHSSSCQRPVSEAAVVNSASRSPLPKQSDPTVQGLLIMRRWRSTRLHPVPRSRLIYLGCAIAPPEYSSPLARLASPSSRPSSAVPRRCKR